MSEAQVASIEKLRLKTMDDRLIPWTIFFSTMVVVATVYMTQPIMTVLSGAFAVPVERLSVAMSVVSMMYALSFVIYGSVSDKIGRRTLLLYGVVALILMVALVPLASTFQSFIWLTALQGIAAGALPAVAIPYLADITPKEKLGQAMGIGLSGTIAGTVLGRSLSGFLSVWMGWQMTYWLFAGLLVLCFLALLRLPNKNQVRAEASVWRTIGNTLSLTRNGRVLQLLVVGASLFFAYLGSATFLTPYLAGPSFGFSPGTIGLLGFLGCVGIIVSPITGRMIPRFGSYRVMLTGLTIALLGVQLMAYAPSLPLIVAGVTLLYAGVFICQPAVLSLINVITPVDRRGGASALYLLSCMGGGSLGTYALRFAYQSALWPGVIWCASGVCLLALLLAVWYTVRYGTNKGGNEN